MKARYFDGFFDGFTRYFYSSAVFWQGRNEGTGALYKGLGLKGLHTLGQTFLYFYAYSFLKNLYTRRIGKLGELDLPVSSQTFQLVEMI
jgi:hypothetical protein